MVSEMERLDRSRTQVRTPVDPAADDGTKTPASARDTTWLAWTVHDQWPWGGQ